jgi:hypothetical protein
MRQRALSLAVTVVIGVALVSASGAAATTNAQTATAQVKKINVSTRAAVVHYLRSIHVKANGAVIQRGLRNYAGAHCPGGRWTCAGTRHTVVQIAKPGGQNRFVCRSNKCAVVQISGTAHGVYMSGRQFAAPAKPGGGSSAVCIKTGSGATTGTGQSCSLSQSGSGPNTAGVYENTQKVSGLAQAAQYTALITQQSSGSNGNQACVTQIISLDGSTANTNGKPTTVTLKAHQSVIINQDAVGSGMNRANQPTNSSGACISAPVIPQQPTGTSALTQSQTLTSSVNATGTITQNEDRNDDPAAQNPNPSPSVTDSTTIPCAPKQGDNSDTANLCLDVEQNQGAGHGSSGTNAAVFWQENYLSAVAHTVSGRSINQIQGAQKDGLGGLLGTVNQDSSGPSNFVSTQNETQCEDALSTTVPIPNTTPCSTAVDGFPSGVAVIQNQYGPEGVGNAGTAKHNTIHAFRTGKDPTTSSQTGGGSSDTYTINQTSKQNNDSGAIQNNHILGGLSTPGSGTINQNANIQNQNKGDVQTGGGVNFQSFINCDGTDPTHPKVSCTKTLSKPKIETEPSNPTDYGAGDASFTFSNSDSTVQYVCKLDTATTYTLCNTGGTGSFSHPNLPSGSHTLSVKTQDADNGNQSADDAHYTWVITPPDPTITASSKPNDPSAFGTSGSFQFTDADPTAIFKCKLDGAATYTACTSGSVSTNLSSGLHPFSVKAYDSTGTYVSNNDDHYSWVITPPDPTITDGPGSLPNPQTTSTDATFAFDDADSTALFECNLDSGGYSPCSSTPTFTGLSHGPHTLVVKATDSTGSYDSTGTAEYDWEVIPYLTFESDGTGASAGWEGGPGLSSIDLTVGSPSATTYAQFTIHDSAALTVNALAEPTFATDTFSGGSPRYEVDFSNGDYAFGYPSQQGWGTDSWALNCGHVGCVPMEQVSWGAIQTAEGSETVTDALVEADGGQSPGTTDVITAFTFNGHSLSFFTN